MEFQEIVKKSGEVRELYDGLNDKQNSPRWSTQEYVQGLTGDLGDLTKLTMMHTGLRAPADNLDEKIRHELCDCLWSVIEIARTLDVDLETEFPRQMDELKKRITTEKH